MEDKYIRALADCVRIAYDKGYAEDFIVFDLDNDEEGFMEAFKNLFGEEF